MFVSEVANDKRVLTTKTGKSKSDPRSFSLAERILMNRHLENHPAPRPLEPVVGRVKILDPTNKNYKRQTPFPEPGANTKNQQPPLKRPDIKKNINPIVSEQPGSSYRKYATPPLPPIKTASQKAGSKTRTPTRQSRSNAMQNTGPLLRQETPILPPIEHKDSRAGLSKASTRTVNEIQPPKDMQKFDPDIGVDFDFKEMSYMPKSVCSNESEEAHCQLIVDEKIVNRTREQSEIEKSNYHRPASKHERYEREKPVAESHQKLADEHAYATSVKSSQKSRSRTRSRSKSRKKSKSKSRSKSRDRKNSRSRSSSHSSSKSKRRSRRSRSRKRYRSNSCSTSTSSIRRRACSSSLKRNGQARSKSRRRSFDYDFERAKSIVRSLSRLRSSSMLRQRSPSIEYNVLDYNTMFGPQTHNQTPKRKKKIIIVQGGGMLPQQTKQRNKSSSDSDISVVIARTMSKSRARKGKVSGSDTEETDETKSKFRENKAKKKKREKTSKKEASSDNHNDTDTKNKEVSKKPDKNRGLKTAKRTIRFGIDDEKSEHKNKQKESESEEENDENNLKQINKSVQPSKQKPYIYSENETLSVVPLSKEQKNKAENPDLKNNKMESSFFLQPQKNSAAFSKNAAKKIYDQRLMEALEQLDKRNDFELEQLKGGNLKLPPDVNLGLKKKIFSKEFQENINAFLKS